MAGNSAGLKLTAWVDDKATAPLKSIGKEAERMGQGFSKSAAALRLVEGAAGQMGGSIADATGKVSGIIALVGSGGPLGLGVAALTAGVGLAATAWQAFGEQTRLAAEEIRSMEEKTRKSIEAVVDLDRKIRDFGKTALQAEIDQLVEEIRLKKEAVVADQAMLASSRDLVKGRGQIVAIGEEINQNIADNRTVSAGALAAQQQQIKADETRLAKLNQLLALEKEKTAGAAASAAAERAANVARAKAEEAIRKQRDALAKLNQEIDKALAKNIPEPPPIPGNDRAPIELTREEIEAINDAAEAERNRGTITADERDKFIAAEKSKKLAARQTAKDIITSTGEGVAALIASSEAGSAKQREEARRTAMASIAASAAKGAAEAFASQAGIPIIGPALGAVAAAAVGVAIMKLAKFQHGGVVRGGIKGRDSVPIMAQQGETVLPVGLSNALRNVVNSNGPAAGSSPGFASGGTVRRAASGGGTTVVNFTSLERPTAIEARRIARMLTPAMGEMRRRGMG